jgi:hypothetical protein
MKKLKITAINKRKRTITVSAEPEPIFWWMVWNPRAPVPSTVVFAVKERAELAARNMRDTWPGEFFHVTPLQIIADDVLLRKLLPKRRNK